MTKYAISMYPEGICLNPKEYALDKPNGDVLLFKNRGEALAHLRANWEDMPENADEIDEYGVFVEMYEDDVSFVTIPKGVNDSMGG